MSPSKVAPLSGDRRRAWSFQDECLCSAVPDDTHGCLIGHGVDRLGVLEIDPDHGRDRLALSGRIAHLREATGHAWTAPGLITTRTNFRERFDVGTDRVHFEATNEQFIQRFDRFG